LLDGVISNHKWFGTRDTLLKMKVLVKYLRQESTNACKHTLKKYEHQQHAGKPSQRQKITIGSKKSKGSWIVLG
jgi:hypothetical protein